MKDTCFHGIGPDGDCEMCRDIITAIRPSDRSPSPSPDASLLEARSLVARLAAAEARAERAEATAAKLTAERDYLRAWKAWAGGMAHRLLAANPEPQPPEGCAP